jgi:cytochrome c-type biogenesis protein CcmH
MPLATVRKQVKDLPLTVTLDDSMAMTPAMKLSGFPEVVLEARVSKSGNAVSQPGDLEAERVTAKVGSEEPVELTVNQVVGEKAQGQGPPTGSGGVSVTAEMASGGTVGPAASEGPEGAAPPGGRDAGQNTGGEAAAGGAQSAAEQGSLSDTSRSASAETAGRGLQVRVTIASNLADKISPEDTLFVYARAPQGPRMPLAIVRKQAKDLPTTVTLDDSSSMMPGMPLSSLPMVVLGARVSKSGNAMPQSGDLQGFGPAVQANSNRPVEITIDKVIP